MKSDRIKSWPKNERPRERLLANGAEALSDAELLAVILRVGQGTFQEGVAGQNATAFAKQILKEFGGLRGIDRSHMEDLAKVRGLGPAKISQIKAAIEIGKRVQTKPLHAPAFDTSATVATHFRPHFVNARHEKVIVVLLNGQNQFLGEKVIADGTPTQTVVHVRKVLEEALRASATTIVLIHNHPSGCVDPSPEDDATTQDIDKAANILGILFLDHIIVGETDHFSYADSGRLSHLREHGETTHE